MQDNKTSHAANDYDAQINKTIPNYHFFHEETLEIVKVTHPRPVSWLDTGCGTGTLVEKAAVFFADTQFVLADPSEQMLAIAKEKLAPQEKLKVQYLLTGTQDIAWPEESFEVITAIQSHHYLDAAARKKATQNCLRLLKPGGIYITFENISAHTDRGIQIGLERWKQFQMKNGKNEAKADEHIARFGKEYFPISLAQHMALLQEAGFGVVEVLWASIMQAGFYAIKK